MTKTERARLVAAAEAAQKKAYCPYSHFPVGAAVLAGGEIYAGCNVENASYGLSLCAERNAVAAAVGAGRRDIRAVAIVARQCKPCGACRQVLIEFCGKDAELILVSQKPKRVARSTTMGRMLPEAFTPKDL